MITCNGCDKDFQETETASYQRNADGALNVACRKCIGAWIAEGFLWASIPFWMRREANEKDSSIRSSGYYGCTRS